MKRRTALALWATLAVVGSAGVVVVSVAAGSDRPDAATPPTFGSSIASRLADPTPTPTPTPSSRPPSSTAKPTPTPTPKPTPTSTSRSTPRPPANAAPPGSAHRGPGPVGISIPAAGISATVVPVGVESDGEVEVPEDVRTLGWYEYSPDLPAGAGSTVVVGHVDSAVQGTGAFFTLHEVQRDDRVYVRSATGRVLTYRVVALQAYPKTNVPLEKLFERTGAPRLTLITCGGSFDSSARSYLDNIVVTAVPT